MQGNVLLVDDDPRVAEVVADVLDERGIRTTWVPTVRFALSVLGRSTLPEMTLVDYWLSDGNGIEVIVAAIERGVACCLVTGDSAIADLMRMHGVTVLRKPFGEADLCDAMSIASTARHVVGGHRIAAQLAQLRFLDGQLSRGMRRPFVPPQPGRTGGRATAA